MSLAPLPTTRSCAKLYQALHGLIPTVTERAERVDDDMPRTETVPPSPTDCLLLHLLVTAAQELHRHVADAQQRCHACGAQWPCPRAELAAFTLEAG
jgi:hypothetical protein